MNFSFAQSTVRGSLVLEQVLAEKLRNKLTDYEDVAERIAAGRNIITNGLLEANRSV